MELFQQLLNKARKGYAEADKRLMAKSKHLSDLAKRIEAFGFKPEY